MIESSLDETVPIQQEVIVISEPEKIRILMDDTRRDILDVMRKSFLRDGKLAEDMSVGEIAEILKSAPQRIYHHIDKLQEHGFVVKSREEKKVRSSVTYYKRTAKVFFIAYDESNVDSKQIYSQRSERYVATMDEAFALGLKESEKEQLSNLLKVIWAKNVETTEKIYANLKKGFSNKSIHHMRQFMLSALLYGDEEYQDTMKKISKIISPHFS